MSQSNTLRLVFPQWQGGNNEPYYFGAQLLNWLAPETNGPIEFVEVEKPDGNPLTEIQGIVARNTLINQLEDAQEKILKHQPDRLVILGGDCLVDLAPFSYLNEKYGGELAVLWIDAHPDIMTPNQFKHAHAMVLGNLLGHGDEQFRSYVSKPLKAKNVCYLGVNEMTDWEKNRMSELGLKNISPDQFKLLGTQSILNWFTSTGAKHLAIHIDLDAIDPTLFRSLLFANVDYPEGTFDGVAKGKLSMSDIVEAISEVNKVSDIVGIGIAEHLPWDALALKKMLEKLPLLS
ncbi:arginase family protein [Aeromonas caviae]|uniref:arginase family protein n=1 Tax=Aeromonas caviae TaxID=648 RepID=UPI002B49ECF8|nr:arginase family protein [Aeromonas caviae]